MQTKVYDIKGVEKGFIELDDSVFNVEVSDGAIYYAINNELANRRVGTACTKTRAEVNYSNVKPFKQKGTGNARQGDKKSPVRVGGGTIFGPRPRDYSFVLPKKMKRCAIKSLLTASVKDNRLTVLEDFTVSGKTKEMLCFFCTGGRIWSDFPYWRRNFSSRSSCRRKLTTCLRFLRSIARQARHWR